MCKSTISFGFGLSDYLIMRGIEFVQSSRFFWFWLAYYLIMRKRKKDISVISLRLSAWENLQVWREIWAFF